MKKVHRIQIGQHRGHARVWLDGKWLEEVGFSTGTFYLRSWNPELRRLALHLPDLELINEKPKVVSGHHNRPVIDISNKSVEVWFANAGEDQDGKVYVNVHSPEHGVLIIEEAK